MSYDVFLSIDTGSGERIPLGEDWNMTSNVAPMWRKAGADIAQFDGLLAGDVLPYLLTAIEEMETNPDSYRALNPRNGWGSYGTCLEFLRNLAKGFARHPRATVEVSR